MLTRIVEFCAENGLLISIRVSLDGIGDVHDQVRAVKNGFDKASQTIEAMQALAATHANFSVRHRLDDLRDQPRGRARTSSPGRATKGLDIVFNMLRFTDAMLHNKELEEKIGFQAARRRRSCAGSSSIACRRNRS